MTQRQSLNVEWVLDRDASSDEVATVTQILLEEGLTGQVKAAYSQKSLGDHPWIILVLAPVALFLRGFFDEAGRAGYQDVRRLVSRLLSVRQKGAGHVELTEKDSLTTVVIPRGLPEEAFKQLANLELGDIEGKYWVWDWEQRCWIHQAMDGK